MPVPAATAGEAEEIIYAQTSAPGARLDFQYHGQNVQITFSRGPDRGIWEVWLDGQLLLGSDTGKPVEIDAFSSILRYGETRVITVSEPGVHTLSLVNSGRKDENSSGLVMSLAAVEVLPGLRRSNLGLIIAMILGLEVVGLALSFLLGRALFSGLAAGLDTQRSILLALLVYVVIAIWGFFLNSVLEFWFLAWMVAIVQGGSQALSRSLYARMSPAAKSGEFFGLFGIMEKFSAILGPLLFAAAGAIFNNSRPAVLSLIVFFIIGGYILMRVNVAEGQRVARAEDTREFGGTNPPS